MTAGPTKEKWWIAPLALLRDEATVSTVRFLATLLPDSSPLGRFGATALCWIFWLWLRSWPPASAIATAVGTSALIAISVSSVGRRRAVGRLVTAALTLSNFAGFYAGQENSAPLAHRLSSLPAGHALFSASVLWALGDSLFSLEPWIVQWTIQYVRRVAYGLSLFIVVLLAADSYFVGKGTPFKYPTFPPPQPARVFPADEGYAHASEHFMADTSGLRFTQRKPDGTTRIVLNGASTMWGHGLAPDERPAAVLRRLLTERFPDRRFEVVSLAWPGKYQMNELVDSAVTIPHWQPDLVLSFNGFNEIWYGEDSSRFEGMPFWQEWQTAALSVSASRALFYEHTQFGASIWPGQIFHDEVTLPALKEPDLYEPPRYYEYVFATARTLAEHGVRYVQAFCPNAIEMDADEAKTMARDVGTLTMGGSFAGLFSEVRQRRRLSKRVVELGTQRSYDAMAPFARMTSEEAFVDACHLSKTGVGAVMSDVAAHLTEWLEAPLVPLDGPWPSQGFAPLRLSAKAGAPFFTVGVGRRVGNHVMTNGSVGMLEASPRLALPAGRYRARWYGRINRPGRLRAEIVGIDGAPPITSTQYADAPAQASPTGTEQLLVGVEAEIAKPARNVEYRIFVESQETNIELQQVIFEQIWTE